MNETLLNVRGADAVVDAVRRCWASLFGARTVYYRAKRGFGQADMDIAVVVQRQIASTRAGVMFTIDPAVRGHRPARHRGRLRPRRVGRLGLGLPRPLRRRQGRRWRSSRAKCGARSWRSSRSPAAAPCTRELGEHEAEQPVLSDDEVGRLAELGDADRGPLRLAPGHRVGDRRRGRDLDAAVAAGDRHRRHRPGRAASRSAAAELVRGLGAAPGIGRRAGAGSWRRSPTPASSPTARSWSPT